MKLNVNGIPWNHFPALTCEEAQAIRVTKITTAVYWNLREQDWRPLKSTQDLTTIFSELKGYVRYDEAEGLMAVFQGHYPNAKTNRREAVKAAKDKLP